MFVDRTDAGKQLAQALIKYKGQPVVVYALPRGGVVLGAEVARFLEAPLDLIVVRKIGHPFQPEYAIGAIAEDGYVVTNPK
jgi:predicted phosphoribosyltransferase